MAHAVRAVVKIKYGADGIFRSAGHGSAWPKHSEVVQQVQPVSEATIQAVIAYCEYLWKRYGRFPVYMPPYRTVLGFQACPHLDAQFYDKFYQREALSETQRKDFSERRSPTRRNNVSCSTSRVGDRRFKTHAIANATSGSSVVSTASNVQPPTEYSSVSR